MRSAIRTPPAVPERSLVEALEAAVKALLEVGDERRRFAWLADRRVVDVAVLLKVAGQVLVGVAPALRAGDMDLATSQSIAQRSQHAQLIGDSLDLAVLVDDGLTPLLRNDAVERDMLTGRVKALLAGRVDVTAEQLERVHDRPVGAVGAAKLERLK